jgi:hypothetical protein
MTPQQRTNQKAQIMTPKQYYKELVLRNKLEWQQQQRAFIRKPFIFAGAAFFIIVANVTWLGFCLFTFGCDQDKYPIVVAPLLLEFLVFFIWSMGVLSRSVKKSFTIVNKAVNPELYTDRVHQLLPNSNPTSGPSTQTLTPPPIPPFIPTPKPGYYLVEYAQSIHRAWISMHTHKKVTRVLEDCLYNAWLAGQQEHACRYFGLTPREFEQIRTSNFYRGW